ncbi:unnamed protein product [Porites lobata]|uniref:Ig-like domain-containing protein n=1 Tax=Porites lobata TaxID=104759 RepID=A0ABN8RPR6_9CNID|nr:unnamed protein product [Porites lobata]
MEVYNFNVVCGIFFLIHNFILLDGFQWSLRQQESDVIDVAVGSDITLPCEYILTPEEQQEADVFHLITWTREEPMNSKNWTGLAAKSKLTGSKIIHDDPGRISFTEGSLTLKNINVKDHTFYQCAFYSSFFTTPSTIELNVQYKPTETQLTAPSKEAKEGEPFKITCTARANPTPVYQFYRDGKLIRRTSKGVLSFPSIKTEDEGTYRCVPTNEVGEGPEAIVTFTVTVKAYELFPNWAYGAVGGGVLLIIIVAIVVSICCARKGKKKPDNRRKTSQPQNKTRKPKDAREAHVGPGAFYVDNVNGKTEIPRLNEAFSFGDIRMSREFPHLNGALSFNDLRTSHGNSHLNGGFSLGDVRASREALPMKNSFSVDDVRLGEAMQGTYPPQSVTHLIDGVEEHVSNL